jgi:uncharacterized protein with PhoU and TrkA domain
MQTKPATTQTYDPDDKFTIKKGDLVPISGTGGGPSLQEIARQQEEAEPAQQPPSEKSG